MPSPNSRKNAPRPTPTTIRTAQNVDIPTVNQFIATYVMGIANRLAAGASNHYRKIWNIGMSEWRVIVALGLMNNVMIRDIAQQADLDEASASRSVSILKERNLVNVIQTRLRGRPALVTLTEDGRVLHDQIKVSAQFRQARLVSEFKRQEIETLMTLLRKLEHGVTLMNEPAPHEEVRSS